MKTAIHKSGAGSFSEKWIAYCQTHSVPYKIVNCHDSDIIKQLDDCGALMWHHHHADYRDALMAKSVLFSVKASGRLVFPDYGTNWHFDDKIAQKYLLEAINAPLVPSYVFYDRPSALKWIGKTTFPKVFKLKGGAGSANVRLVENRSKAVRLTKKAFSSGFSQMRKFGQLKERIRRFRNGQGSIIEVLKGVGRLVIPTPFARMHGKEKGYVYFQEFIPNNTFDTRVIVIGKRAFAITRGVRENDFRASGSGFIGYDKETINKDCLSISFEVAKKLNSQCLAFDFVMDKNAPLIVEISYGFARQGYLSCPGYWDDSLKWHEGFFTPEYWMVEDLLSRKND